ncbi:MAG: hypothetical protein Q7U47_04470 [Paludibacter sp.]|nr:hypothetical protein [Paludibacter sp.]
MEQYKIVISENAKQDIINLSNVILYDFASPLTAFKYIKGLYKQINTLKFGAESYSIQTRAFFQQYGFNVRKITFKKMSIIYLIVNQYVYIKAIVPTSTINDYSNRLKH